MLKPSEPLSGRGCALTTPGFWTLALFLMTWLPQTCQWPGSQCTPHVLHDWTSNTLPPSGVPGREPRPRTTFPGGLNLQLLCAAMSANTPPPTPDPPGKGWLCRRTSLVPGAAPPARLKVLAPRRTGLVKLIFPST